MLDFVSVEKSYSRNGTTIFPEFIVGGKSSDLMIKGKSFYAVWDEEAGFWTKDEKRVSQLIDNMIFDYAKAHPEERAQLKLMRNFSSNKWSEWQKYCKSLPDSFHELDSKIIFGNEPVKKTDYVSRTLDYPIRESSISAYEELMSTLYAPDERRKLEWAIGAIISGESKQIQKFIVLYGGPGTGKSTVLNIIQDLFPGYCSVFESRALVSSNNSFALEVFRENPLIAIQHDGDLSKIEDNTKLNSIVSHEMMTVNEKFKATYSSRFHSFLFMGTNKPVKITDAKSGILRRLIDVHPTGNKIPRKRFDDLRDQIRFEFPGIAYHCLQVFRSMGPSYYDRYIPSDMMGATNYFYNFVEDNFEFFANEGDEGIGLRSAWARYKEYCEDARVPYPLSMQLFKYELKNYFAEFYDRYPSTGRRSIYVGFLKEKFESEVDDILKEEPIVESWLHLTSTVSEFDDIFKDCPAQYATEDEIPGKSWDLVQTKLQDLNTRKLHYVRPPENLIVVDFDLKNEKGEKDSKKNLEAASRWPQTYAELSKGGHGIHLHYYYDGDPKDLSRIFEPDIEIKVFTGKSSLRRKLIRCNNIPIAHIASGLPLRERRKSVLSSEMIQSEKSLRELIIRNLRKEIHPNTKPSMDFIHKILEDAYHSGLHYDVRDMRPSIQAFAMSSSHQADYCMRLINKMEFCSEEPSENTIVKNDIPIVIFDTEVMPNLFILCWKKRGEGYPVVKMINPSPQEIEEFISNYRLVGFNNRRYDNHILYARMMGYTEEQLYYLSQQIVGDGGRSCMFGEAYNLSYTDIYDFLSAAHKMGLKKWEIKLGIHHQELGIPWDQPVPEELWEKVAKYCCNDVVATEAVWDANQADWKAREILAEWAGMTVNDTTNALTTKLIVGNDPHPQDKFIYTDLSTIFPGYEYNPYGIDKKRYKEGVKFVRGKSIYKGKDPGEGGYAIGYPGMYYWDAVLDVESMHPSSAIKLKVFGEEYTMRFEDIVGARLAIKKGNYDLARQILPKELHKYLNNPDETAALSDALKTAINSVYGLTSASFPNKLRDPRNVDNIVAKYGALFMINLEEEVQKQGYTVVHIKTDSIKIANATPEIIQFVMEYGKAYGFTFDHESTYSKICIVNDSVFIAKYADIETCERLYGYVPTKNKKKAGQWTATGTQFQIPYVFKTLFSKEPIEFKDLCETKSVTTAMYLDYNENLREDEHNYRFVGKVGAFCPVKDGLGGGILLRDAGDGKFSAVVGTKKPGKGGAYRWLEAETAKELNPYDFDRSYYDHLVDEAVDTISKYGDFEQFVGGKDLPECLNLPVDMDEERPFPMNEPGR